MKYLTQSHCNEIACKLNNRPRERHGFLTPIELLSRHVGVAVQT
jgi:IS30 family transposase